MVSSTTFGRPSGTTALATGTGWSRPSRNSNVPLAASEASTLPAKITVSLRVPGITLETVRRSGAVAAGCAPAAIQLPDEIDAVLRQWRLTERHARTDRGVPSIFCTM